MTKQQLRTEYIQKRNQLLQVEYEDMCAKLFKQFQTLDLTNISCVHLFLTINNRREPDTFIICEWLKAAYPQVKIVLPKTNFADNTMQSFADDEDLQLDINAFGITEPISGNEVDAKTIDMMLVPLLAFDKQGFRVGYGKGFYDRFITQCRPDVKLIGLSFFRPVDKIDDLNDFDKPLTACITPDKIYSLTP